MSSMSNSSLVDEGAVAEKETVFCRFVDALTEGCCSICKHPGGSSRVACPDVYGQSVLAGPTKNRGTDDHHRPYTKVRM